MIKLKNVSFAYSKDSANILKNINLEINDGECVAFIGASGCGKTTLTRLINGLAYKFYGGKLKGEISIDGINPLEKELYEIGRKVGSIFQNPKSQFFAENVEDEIAFGLENYGIEIEKIAIASINALDPPIYVFDEPSANLDMKSVEALRKLMLLLKKNKKTIIISEHRLYYLRGVVDKYYYLENGEIINVFTEEELLSKSEDFFNKLGLRFFSLNKISPKINKLKEINSMNLEKISFSYNKNVLIKDLTYDFKSGNIYGIIGDNGIGKSTLFKILSGLMKKDSGFISINGEKLNKRNRQKRIYYLSNNPDSNLFEVSAEDELKLNNKDADTDKILADFNLENVKDIHPQIMSGGQKQRLTIASAELLERDVYLFDEPTSGLDGHNMQIISERMKKLQEEEKIILIISHDYEFLCNSCNKILYLDGYSFKEFSTKEDKEKILAILMGKKFNI